MAMKKKAKLIEDSFVKPNKKVKVKVITKVPKKVVEAKIKINPNAPKQEKAPAPGLKIIPKGSKSKTMTNTEKKQKRLTPPRRVGGRVGGVMGGGRIGQIK